MWTRDPFPGNIIPADRINAAAKAIMQYVPDPNCTTPGVAPWQSDLCYNEHFNKDKFWNWVGKVDHNFSQNDRVFFRYGKNKRNEIRNTSAIRSGPAQMGQLPLDRHNDAVVGDWVHILGGGTVLNVRGSFTYYFEGSQGTPNFGFDSTSLGWPSNVVSQFPAAQVGGLFPVFTFDEFVQLDARIRAERKQDLHHPAEHHDDARQSQHPQRPRYPLDECLQHKLRQRRRPD